MSANYNLLTNAYKDGYEQGFKAGQASRTPIKWPTQKQIFEFQEKTQIYDVDEVVEWLKSFVEKGNYE